MDVAICDDEQIHLNIIESYIRGYKSSISFVIRKFNSGENIVSSYISGERFSIIFLDIRMKKMDGIDTAKEIRKIDRNVIIIFITSFIDYSIKGYEVHAFNYLLKPVTHERFSKTFCNAINEMLGKNMQYYVIRIRNEMIKIDVSDIIYIESFGRKLIAHSKNGDFEYYASISLEEEKLKNYGLIRTHKSFIVNLLYIYRLNSTEIVTKTGISIPLGVRRYKSVFDEFTKFFCGGQN
jgi:two-component system, LytTR family, response regulator LytT